MSGNHARRLNDLEKTWRPAPTWKVWCAEETADGLVEIWTGLPVVPGPNDTVITFHECPSGQTWRPRDAHEQL